MKRLLGFLFLVMLGFTACEGPMGPPGRDGADGRNGRDGWDGLDGESTQWKIIEFDVLPEYWSRVTDDLMGNIFECGFQFPELSKFIFDKGAVVCHLIQYLNGAYIQTPLPYTYFGETNNVLYSENYTYEIKPGSINFIVKISDFDTQAQSPLGCIFRVVLMW